MKKAKLQSIVEHNKGVWIVPFLIPSWCSSCPPTRNYIIIKQETKPTLEDIKRELDYEIED